MNDRCLLLIARDSDPALATLIEQSPYPVVRARIADLSRAGWRYESGRPDRAAAAADGRVIPAAQIGSVVCRIVAVRPNDLPRIHRDDRAYVASEMTAFLRAWVSQFAPTVLPVSRAPRSSGRHVMLWGHSGEPSFDAVRRELTRLRIPLVVVDQWKADSPVPRDDIGSVFVRPHALEGLVFDHDLFNWTDTADAFVLNRPSAMASNASKPLQSRLIAERGFEIPATLVTTTPDDVREFIDAHEDVIYKSVSDSRSIVSRMDASDLESLDDVTHCPTQFQAYVTGTDWRVHVVGDDLFAAEITCDEDDYRWTDHVDIRSGVLPAPIAERCHTLAHALQLPLAGIDLRRTDDDEWYCFEVNPAPAFTYYEQQTGAPLTAAVAALLSPA